MVDIIIGSIIDGRQKIVYFCGKRRQDTFSDVCVRCCHDLDFFFFLLRPKYSLVRSFWGPCFLLFRLSEILPDETLTLLPELLACDFFSTTLNPFSAATPETNWDFFLCCSLPMLVISICWTTLLRWTPLVSTFESRADFVFLLWSTYDKIARLFSSSLCFLSIFF